MLDHNLQLTPVVVATDHQSVFFVEKIGVSAQKFSAGFVTQSSEFVVRSGPEKQGVVAEHSECATKAVNIVITIESRSGSGMSNSGRRVHSLLYDITKGGPSDIDKGAPVS